MEKLDYFMPTFQLRQIDRVRVRASREDTWALVRNIDFNELPISQLLFDLRDLPRWVIESFRKEAMEPERTAKIDDFTGPGRGFKVLFENAGEQIVIGSIGKFWEPKISWSQMDSDSFAAFVEPGYGKLVWALRVDPDAHAGSWISWELRVTATDAASSKSFSRYWFFIGPFSHGLRKLALRHFQNKLGGPVSDEIATLPGDDIFAAPKFQKTMSTTIEAPPSKVWSWLIKTDVGDILPWRPDQDEGFEVLAKKEGQSLTLGTTTTTFRDSWTFVLEPIGTGATHLVTRVRADFEPSVAWRLIGSGYNLAHVAMEKAQLKGIKNRIEATTART